MGYNVVLWVDSNSPETGIVKQPHIILETDYDIILLAVSRPEYVESIKQSLRGIGVGEDKLVWKEPVRAL